MDNQPSRYEVNRNIRQILVRHDVDLARLDYSYIGNTAYISGDLLTSTNLDFTSSAIEVLAREIAAITHVRNVQFDLTNWMIASSSGAWQITKKKRPMAGQSGTGAAASDQTIVIEKPETIVEVLKDIHKTKEDQKKNTDKAE